MKKLKLIIICFAVLFVNIHAARAFAYMSITPLSMNLGTHAAGYFYPGGTPFKVNIYGADPGSTLHCTVNYSSGSTVFYVAGMPLHQTCPIDAGGNYYFWVYPSVTFPMVGGAFVDELYVNLDEDATVWDYFTVTGNALPPVGINDDIALTSSPTPISPSFGTCTSLPYCAPAYSAHFDDVDDPTFVLSWTWSLKLFYKGGTYTVTGTASSTTINSTYTIPTFTLPDYEWTRDANNDILAQIHVGAYDSDGWMHYADDFIGVKYPPNKAKVSISQRCPDLQLTYFSQGASSYKIYYSTVPGPPYSGTGITQGSSPISAGTTNNFTLTGLAVGTPYYITVKGVNANGESVSYADPVVFTPMNCNDNITGCINAPNLVTNGNFSSGNTGFTSGLPYNGTCMPASYFVGTQLTSKCSSWSSINFNDHTSGTGNFLIIDGHQTAATNIWNQNVTVNANTTYTFSFWARSLYSYPFSVGFVVNGTTISTTPSLSYGSWKQYTVTWFSGSTFGSIPLSLRQLVGDDTNDFAIDDIYFGHCTDMVHGCSNPYNLAVNGNFSSGNTGFTSGLSYGSNCYAGYYFIGTQLTSKCSSWAPVNFMDHTTGTGNFEIIDGNASAPCTIWTQNVSVNYNTAYTFSFWARSIYSDPFSVEYVINGTTIGATASITMGSWTEYSINWFSGMTTGSIPIALKQQTGGAYRDFGIDDIYFGYCGFGRREANPEIGSQPASMTVYPNPNNGSFSIVTGTDDARDIFVYDLMGKLIFSQYQVRETTTLIDITDQPKGIYMIEVVNGNSVQTQRVIKQ